MKRKGFRLLALFLLLALTLCGCGTAMYELTDEEERIITRYAAYVVAKHNIYQKDGMVSVNPDLIDGEEETQTPAEEEPEPEKTTQQPDAGSDNAAENEQPAAGSVTMAEAIGYGDQLSITYNGYDVTDNYQEGKVYSLDAHSGYRFVITKFTAKNISGASLKVNMLDQNLSFRMSYDGKTWVKEDVTLLLSDLSTYTGTIGIGESVDLVLLFEVKKDAAADLGDLMFSVDKDGDNYRIAP